MYTTKWFSYIYIYTSILGKFFSHLGYYRILSKVPKRSFIGSHCSETKPGFLSITFKTLQSSAYLSGLLFYFYFSHTKMLPWLSLDSLVVVTFFYIVHSKISLFIFIKLMQCNSMTFVPPKKQHSQPHIYTFANLQEVTTCSFSVWSFGVYLHIFKYHACLPVSWFLYFGYYLVTSLYRR